jgi:hypothetical protein
MVLGGGKRGNSNTRAPTAPAVSEFLDKLVVDHRHRRSYDKFQRIDIEHDVGPEMPSFHFRLYRREMRLYSAEHFAAFQDLRAWGADVKGMLAISNQASPLAPSLTTFKRN